MSDLVSIMMCNRNIILLIYNIMISNKWLFGVVCFILIDKLKLRFYILDNIMGCYDRYLFDFFFIFKMYSFIFYYYDNLYRRVNL